MKKIIAAALSILVGTFGYTIVDQALENRVATLESEVVELREEVEGYHKVETATVAEVASTIKPMTTKRHTTTTKARPTRITTTAWTPKILSVGDYIEKSSDFRTKFLMRGNWYGSFYYVSPYSYGGPITTTTQRPTTTKVPTTTQRSTTCIPTYATTYKNETTIGGNVSFSNGYIVPVNDDPELDPAETTVATTTKNQFYNKDYFLYITDSVAQITEIGKDVSYSYYYDNDYSQASRPIESPYTLVTVKCVGYTDPALAGKKIIFDNDYSRDFYIGSSNVESYRISSNTINSDGTFEYEAQYKVPTNQLDSGDRYKLTYPTIK